MTKSRRTASVSPAGRITAAIIEKLEQGTKPWVKPWRGLPLSRPLRSCGTPYRGMNTFQVRKGEQSTIAIFYKRYTKEVENAEGGQDTESRRVLKAYSVFNAAQCDGLPEFYHPKPLVAALAPEGREERLDAFFGQVGANLRHHGAQAYYEPLRDRVTMPPVELFEAYDHYYATLAHELSHWTGHSSRLDRDLKNRFGSDAYAAEELIAELSSAILGAELGLPVTHLDHHASYIASWLKILKSDERAILTAAAKAEEAATLLLDLGGHQSSDSEANVDVAPEISNAA